MTGWRRAATRKNLFFSKTADTALTAVLMFGLFVGSCVVSKPSTAADETETKITKIQGLEISAESGATRLRLQASGQPAYDLKNIEAPPSVQVDLHNIDLGSLPDKVDVDDGTVKSVQVSSLPDSSARIVIALDGPGDATAVPTNMGLDLVVRLRGEIAASTSDSRAEGMAKMIDDGSAVEFNLGAEPAGISAFILSDDKRLVVDADGISLPSSSVSEDFDKGPLLRARFGQKENGVRGVVEAREAGAFSNYRVEKTSNGFLLAFNRTSSSGGGSRPESVSSAQSKEMAEEVEFSPEAEEKHYPVAGSSGGENFPGGGKVVDLGFRQTKKRSLVEIAVSEAAPHNVSEATAERVVLDLEKTKLTKKFQRALDTTAFPGAVKLIAAYQQGSRTRIVVDLKKMVPFKVERDPTHIVLAFEGGAGEGRPLGVAGIRRQGDEIILIEGGEQMAPLTPSEAKAAIYGRTGPELVAPGERHVYTGQRVSMDFVDADLKNILRLLGDVSGLNIVAGDDVSGTITVRLVDVPWDQALDVILKTRGLGKVHDGNVVRIANADKLAAEKQRREDAIEAQKVKEPLVTDIIPVNYATAKEVSDKVTAILSDRGSATIDERTNSILIKDVAAKIAEAKDLVARLDTQTPQVLIEARIVEVSSTFAKDLGIQWGGRFTADTAHGNSTDWAFPHSIGLTGSTGTNNYAINLPGGGGSSAALALSLGHINDILSLDLRLSALETAGKGKVVSSPRVTTLDNRSAEIRQGIEIPFTTATQEKVETKSITYLLKMSVTPHVTADSSIMMKIDVSKDAPSPTFSATDGTPAVETRAANTEVLVKDGETTVIGGIITDTQSDTNLGVPWLSKIPFLGWAFKKKDTRMDKTELVIFITPRIVTPSALSARSL